MMENMETEFKHKQNIKIITGFYRDYYGTIEGYDMKTQKYRVKVKIDQKDEEIQVLGKDLKSESGWFKR